MLQFDARWVPKALVLALGLHVLFSPVLPPANAAPGYPWHPSASLEPGATLEARVPPPPGFARIPAPPATFAAWLRGLPMKPDGSPVRLYNGRDKWRQDAQAAVIDIDTGTKDLQQCADAIMRLRAEWLLATGRGGDIGFNYTGGGRVSYARWSNGERPSANGRAWSASAKSDGSYASFRRYMEQVFSYAGTYSLERELKPAAIDDLQIGDVFIKGGFPGHAVLVADMAENAGTRERRFLLVQSFMPAQDMHVLKNPGHPSGSPWYPAAFTGDLVTPEWTFPRTALKRWP